MKSSPAGTTPLISLSEWESKTIPDLSLSEGDRKLLLRLKGEDAESDYGLTVEELRHGVRIQATSWVGLVQFENFAIQVRPRMVATGASASDDNLCLVKMLEFTSGLSALRRLHSERTILIEELNLFDLLILLLAKECEKVLRAGLLPDYVTREATLGVLRGRLLADRQLFRHFGRVDLLECRYDEHETDTPENQLLALTLRLATSRVRDPQVQLQVRRLAAIFEEVCDPGGLNHKLLRFTISYHRLNEHYRPAHELAWVILEGLGVQDLLSQGKTGSFTFLFDMNLLFEQFVWRVLERLFEGYSQLEVRYQSKNRSILWNVTTNRTYRSIIPDLLVQNRQTGKVIPVDTKYKPYYKKKVDNSDLYQMFMYAFAYNYSEPQRGGMAQALLIHPSLSEQVDQPVIVEVRTGTQLALGRIKALGIHIPALLEEVNKGYPGPVCQNLLWHLSPAN